MSWFKANARSASPAMSAQTSATSALAQPSRSGGGGMGRAMGTAFGRGTAGGVRRGGVIAGPSIQPTMGGFGGGAVKMMGPDGSTRDVPAMDVSKFERLGARKV